MEGTQDILSPAPGKSPVRVDIYSVAPRFFETLGIPLIAGEDFRGGVPADDIVIVNQAFAAQAFPGENLVGRRIDFYKRSLRIVGVVGTAKSRTIGEEPHPCFYFPIARDARGNDSLTGITLALRTRGDPVGYVTSVRQTIGKIEPTLAVFDVRTMDVQIEKALLLPRVSAALFGLAGLMGLLISTVGIYGVISFSVARQTKDIGIRVALGARRAQVLGMVLRQGLTLTFAGCAIGMLAALALSRITASLLYGVSPTDGLTFAAVPAALFTIAAIACLVPARRAAKLDPIRALRCE
jgi:predicted permease